MDTASLEGACAKVASYTVDPEQQSFSIVTLGDFNPAIFQPLWFSINELVPREEAENANIAVIHREIAAFSVGEVKVQVDQTRFGLTTQEATQGPILRDLALGTLALLEHTPLQAIGLNLDMEFEIGSEEAWHALGNRLAPKTDWEPFLEQPGMRNLVVEGKRADCTADRLQIRVQPSGRTP